MKSVVTKIQILAVLAILQLPSVAVSKEFKTLYDYLTASEFDCSSPAKRIFKPGTLVSDYDVSKVFGVCLVTHTCRPVVKDKNLKTIPITSDPLLTTKITMSHKCRTRTTAAEHQFSTPNLKPTSVVGYVLRPQRNDLPISSFGGLGKSERQGHGAGTTQMKKEKIREENEMLIDKRWKRLALFTFGWAIYGYAFCVLAFGPGDVAFPFVAIAWRTGYFFALVLVFQLDKLIMGKSYDKSKAVSLFSLMSVIILLFPLFLPVALLVEYLLDAALGYGGL